MGDRADPGSGTEGKVTAFLSYSREDRDRAVALVEALTREHIDVWWDGLLAGGDSFAHATETALETSAAVVVLWSAHSIQSHWVRDEATRGRDRGCMVPVSLDGTQPPLGFRQVQFMDLSGWDGTAHAKPVVALAKAIKKVAESPVNQLRFAHVAAAPGGFNRRRMLAAAAATGVAGLAGLGAWQAGLLGSGPGAARVAVLPFRNLSGDAGQDYFTEGLAEELRSTLSRDPDMEVAATTSSDSFHDGKTSIPDIARKLGVQYVVEGSVRRIADRFRIAVRVLEGRSSLEKWSDTFDRSAENLLTVQDEIASLVADTIVSRLVAIGQAQGVTRIGSTDDVKAFDAYLKGRALYKQATGEESDRQALAAFDNAIRRDPEYAAAHAARSKVLTVIGNAYEYGAAQKARYREATEAARRSVEIAPDFAEAYSALGFVLFSAQLDARAARDPYLRCYELGIGNADILVSFVTYASRVGLFDEGRKAIARAERLDPLNMSVFRTSGMLEFFARNYDAALTQFRTTLSFNPKVWTVHAMMGDIALLRGKPADAHALYLKEPDETPRLRGLAVTERLLKGEAAGLARLAELKARYPMNSDYQQAQTLAQWGQTGPALDALEKALLTGDVGILMSKVDPMLDPLRKSGRFIAIQQKLGLGDAAPIGGA